MTTGFWRRFGAVAWRAGVVPGATDIPDLGLVEAVEGPSRLPPGRALDLGCGTGRNAVYLARHGWQVTGVDLVGHALATARRRAAAAGVAVRLVEGDVTRLDELGVGGGYELLVDAGCYQGVPIGRRDAYAAQITAAAAPGALLVMFAIARTPIPNTGLTPAALAGRLPGWRLLDATPVSGAEMHRYVRGPATVVALLGRGPLAAARYRLRRAAS